MKPTSLREAITTALPEFKSRPDALCMWIEKGRIRSPISGSENFEWAYTLNITIEAFTRHPSIVFMTVNHWLRRNQPELLQPGERHGYEFEADVVDEKTVDLHLTLALTERVAVGATAEGAPTLQHLAEPASFLPGDEPLTYPAATLGVLRMDDAIILPGADA